MLATRSLPHTAVGTGGAATPSEWTGELRVPAAATLKQLSLRDGTSAAGKGRGGSGDAQHSNTRPLLLDVDISSKGGADSVRYAASPTSSLNSALCETKSYTKSTIFCRI